MQEDNGVVSIILVSAGQGPSGDDHLGKPISGLRRNCHVIHYNGPARNKENVRKLS
jgi:hypothetical protein